MMTRQEFQDIVHEIAGFAYVEYVREDKAKGIVGVKSGYHGALTELKESWVTGGAWGGNCWGDQSPESYRPDPEHEPELNHLDDILVKVNSNVSFLQYKKIMSKVKYDNYSQYEYYGNYTNYGIKTLKIDDLWDSLKELNLV